MNIEIKSTVVEVLKLRQCLEVDPYVPFDYIIDKCELQLLEAIKPYIKTQHFKRFKDDPGYVESHIWMPSLEEKNKLEELRKYNVLLQERIDEYNDLPWWKKMFRDV